MGAGRITLGADKAFVVDAFVRDLRVRNVMPSIAVNGTDYKTGTERSTAIDRRTSRNTGYVISVRLRKRIGEVFGWAKAQAGFAKTRLRGKDKVEAAFGFVIAAHKLFRIPKRPIVAPI